MIELRRFSKDHLSLTFEWISESKFKEDFMLDRDVSLADHLKWFDLLLTDPTQEVYSIYADQAHVGNIGIKHINLKHKTAESWVYIGSDLYKGRSIATTSYLLLFELLVARIRKIYCHVNTANVPSLSLHLKVGFKLEGILKDELFFKEKSLDIIRLAYFL